VPYRSRGASGVRRPGVRQPVSPKLSASLSPARLPNDDLGDDAVYLSLEFENIDLADRSAASVEIDQCRFKAVNLARTELDRAVISDAVFVSCDLANLRARGCSLVRVSLASSRMTGMSWVEGAVHEATFEGCRMDLASFRFSSVKSVVFADCKLMQADFAEADLRGARFERCDLTGAQFSKAQMEGTRFADCTLDGIGGVLSLSGVIMTSGDALGLAYTLASALGITIED
jgi:uncharacterized protein YjbI with pentapeptide repeats